jgi:hypothetical protein
MESVVDGRALTEGDHGRGARATISGVPHFDDAARLVDSPGMEPALGGWR